MTNPSADLHSDPDVIHRYVAGTLSSGEADAFERHLLECPRCQADVREGSAIRSSLLSPVAAAGSRRRRPAWGRMLLVPAVAAAAVLVALLVWTGRAESTRSLGRVETLPRFVPLSVRAPNTETTRLLDSAMAAYGDAAFSRAHAMLSELITDDAGLVVRFYAGCAALGAGDPRSAAPHFARVLREAKSAGIASPYSSEARYLLAKAWLQLGETDSASATLATATDVRGRALLDSVQRRRRR